MYRVITPAELPAGALYNDRYRWRHHGHGIDDVNVFTTNSLFHVVCTYALSIETRYIVVPFSGEMVKMWQIYQKAGAAVTVVLYWHKQLCRVGRGVIKDTTLGEQSLLAKLNYVRDNTKHMRLLDIHMNRKPVEVSESGSDLTAFSNVDNKANSGVLYLLQRSDRRFRLAYQTLNLPYIVERWQYERVDAI